MADIDSLTANPDQPPAQPEYADPVETTIEAEVADPTALEPEDAPAMMPEIEDPEGEIDELEDRSLPVERTLWAIKPDLSRTERVYTQKGLMWFGKIELYGLLGQAVRVVLEGDNPMGVGNLLDFAQDPQRMINDLVGNLPGATDAPDVEDAAGNQMEMEAGKILAAFAEVVANAPQLLAHAYCIALAVPKTHRNWAIEWAFPNMDDEMGKDILHTFIDQNWGVMEDFFAQELPKIVKRIAKERSKRSAGPR